VSGNVFGSLASNSDALWFRSFMNGVTDSSIVCADSHKVSGPFFWRNGFVLRSVILVYRFRERERVIPRTDSP